MVLPSQVVEHFIQEASTHWIMDACLCRDASKCEDYPVDLGCLFLGQAAAGINPKLGRRVTAEEALAHVQRCREAGLIHLVGRNRLDQIWLGVGPGEKLLTICNCCPCCCLWRVLLGDRAVIGDACRGCGRCVDICPQGAIELSIETGPSVEGAIARISSLVDVS
jgi:hypothetical protein